MSKVVRIVVGTALAVAGVLTGNFALALAGAQIVTSSLFGPKVPKRAAASAQLQLGEQPRQAILGRSATGGTLVDAFNYGGKYGTDWEVLVIALADHRCDALEGFFVDDTYVAYTGDPTPAGFNGQLQVYWRDGQWDQTVPSILTTNGPGWTANDRGRGVAYVVVAYKADKSDAKNPVFPSGRPRFRWVVRGLRCYQARKDSTVGGSGAHRRDNPATWEWTENPIDIRYNWVRGIYAGDRVTEPGMLLVGRGLSAIEAPPANVFPRANLCDELVGGQPRYRIGGVVASTEPYIDVETDFAAAVAGVITQPEGAVEVDPGQAKAPVASFTDADLLVGSKVRWSEFLGQQDDEWVNTVAARFVDPGQRWNQRSAPVRRDLADVIADGGPREAQPQLDLVTNQPQAQRIAEIIRRLGRLWGRATVTLPPRFAFIEEGDWVTWQSDRRFGGATLTFRVEAWGSNKAWHHQLTLRQISASVYSDTAPLTDGVVASTQAAPPVVAAPDAGVWNAAAVLLGSGSLRVPNLRVAGTPEDPAAEFVVFEYVPQVAAPDAATIWTFASSSRPDVRLLDIPVIEGGTYWVAVSYVVDGIQGARRVIGPISTSGLTYADGSPIAPVAPGNSNRVPYSRMEGDRGWAVLFNPSSLVTSVGFGIFENRRFFVASPTATAAGQTFSIGSNVLMRVAAGERLSVQAKLDVGLAAAIGGSWTFRAVFRDAGGTPSFATVASGSGGISAASVSSGFVTVPAGQVSMTLELVAVSGASGAWTIAISEPMVTSAAPGQTVHPAYTPGPNAEDGANLTAPANANRVPYSKFEGGRGWFTVGDFTPTPFLIVSDDRFFICAEPTFTAANQNVFLVNTPRIPVQAGQRLSISAAVQAFAMPGGLNPNYWHLYWEYYTSLSAGTQAGITTIGQGFGAIDQSTRHEAFSTVPANARAAQLVLRYESAGAGKVRLAILEPMVASAAAGQTLHPPYTPGPNADDGADVTATAQRTIEPQFPVIEIKQGEAGHTGTRTVTHIAKRGTATLTGGTWSLVSTNLGTGVPAPSATVDSATGTVTLSNIIMSGAYAIRYTHTDGVQTDLAVNVTYVPTPTGGTVSAKTGATTSNTGVGNTNAWSQVISLAISGAPAGRLFFNNGSFTGGNRIRPSTGTGTCAHQARLLINGSVVATVPAQDTFIGGALQIPDFSGLFQEAWPVSAGTVTVAVELQRTSGTGTIATMSNALDVTIIAS